MVAYTLAMTYTSLWLYSELCLLSHLFLSLPDLTKCTVA